MKTPNNLRIYKCLLGFALKNITIILQVQRITGWRRALVGVETNRQGVKAKQL